MRYIYDAYDSGDARTPGEYFHADVEGYVSDFVPWGGPRHGIADVRDGLMLLREHVASTFEPAEIIDSGSYIVAVGRTIGFVHETGRSFSAPLPPAEEALLV